jgi:hypothetical protein
MRTPPSIKELLVVSCVLGYRLFGETVRYSVYRGAAVSYSLPSTMLSDMSILDIIMLTDLVYALTDKSAAVIAKTSV